MLGPAVLGAEEMIASGLGGGEPHGIVAAGNNVVFYTEGWDEEAMDDVFRRERQLDWAIHGHMQFVDLALAFRILDFPHPLLADDVEIHRIRRRAGIREEDLRAPPEEGEH